MVGALCIKKTLKVRARKYVPHGVEDKKLVELDEDEDEDVSVEEDEDFSVEE